MSTTFVTGGTGFVGATVIDQLLARKHRVIAAVRSNSSGENLLAVHPEWDKSQITLVETPDFSAPGTFDTVFEKHPEINYIVHIAAPLMPENADFVEDFEKPGIQGSVAILEAGKKYLKKLKAVAVTGSINAITTGADDEVRGRTLDSTQWLPLGRDEAIQSNHPFVRESFNT
jgi:nucleoside-diphosphate-sugar epimerase